MPGPGDARDLGTGARWERASSPRRGRKVPSRRHPQGDLFPEEPDDPVPDEDDDGDVDLWDEYEEDEYEEDEEDEEADEYDGDEDEDELDEEEDEEWEEEQAEDEEDWWDEDADDYAPPEITKTLRFGVLSMAPLFLGYELALAAGSAGTSSRSVAEVILSVPLEPLGRDVDIVRRLCLGVGLVLAFALSRRQTESLFPRTLRVVAEGAVAALALGPLLALAAGYAEPFVGPLAGAPAGGAFSGDAFTGVNAALLAMGGAAYEEVLFRILLLSLAYVVIRRGLMWAGSAERSAGILAVLGAGLLSATVFAASHLAWATSWLGSGGEPFEASAFTWRICAGILLALLMVWRGVGVAAWAHAFYNLSSILGMTDP